MRKLVDTVTGKLAAVFKEAMRLTDRMKADGVPKDERETFVATALREAWPKSRETPWVYYCDVCSDTGWAVRTCVQGSCGRPFKLPKQHADDRTGQGKCRGGHTYAAPCDCARGEVQRRALLKERRPEDAIDVAAKVAKPTRLGR